MISNDLWHGMGRQMLKEKILDAVDKDKWDVMHPTLYILRLFNKGYF